MDTLQGLTQLGQVPIDMTLEGLKAIGQRQQQDQIGLQELLRKQQFETQADPMRLQRMQTENDISLQDLTAKRRSNKEADFVSDAKMQAEYRGYLAKASDADVQLATSKFQDMAMSDDPAVRARGVAGLRMTKEFILEKQKEDAAFARAKYTADTARATNRDNIDAGKYNKLGKYSLSFSQQLRNENDPVKKLTLIRTALAQVDTDEEMRAMQPVLEEMARVIEPIAAAKVNSLTPKPGTVDITGVTKGAVPTNPSQTLDPKPKPAAKQYSQEDLEFTAKKYGMTVEQVKAKLGVK